MSTDDTKARLLHATITCIERLGLQNATSRDIAAEADANVAAINYHFGSKAKLVELALAATVESGMEDFHRILVDHERPFDERLYDFFLSVLRDGSRFPNIARAHLYDTLMKGAPPGPYLIRLSRLVDEALEPLPPEAHATSRAETARRIEIGLRSCLMRILHPRMLSVSPPDASSIEDDARRLAQLALS